MKPDRQRAIAISTALKALKDTLSKQDLQQVDAGECRAILDTASPDTLAAQEELEMAWRDYNQLRGVQLCTAPFSSHRSEGERKDTIAMLKGERALPTIPAGLQGLDGLKLGIELAISDDIISDAQKWKAIAVENEQSVKKLREFRTAYTRERKEQERKLKEQESKLNHAISRMGESIRMMLQKHVEYWAQNPHGGDHSPNLGEILGILSSEPKIGTKELLDGWHRYENWREILIKYSIGDPYHDFTEDEKETAAFTSRRLPDECKTGNPGAREVLEKHIRSAIRQDAEEDSLAWKRKRQSEEDRRKRYSDQRPARIAKHRKEFTSQILDTFGQEVLDLISEDDINAYSEGMADRTASRSHLWNTAIDKYYFDQKTNSCLYFLRQGAAVKIGITSDLARRFAQIKTSAPLPCKIENVVYTHHGELLERQLHSALADHNTHLEWFVLPPRIEEVLFKAKSKKDIELFLEQLAQGGTE